MAGIQDRKSGSEDQSNHEEVMQAFKDINYVVTVRTVDPSEAGIPAGRRRIHYMGVKKENFKDHNTESFQSEHLGFA